MPARQLPLPAIIPVPKVLRDLQWAGRTKYLSSLRIAVPLVAELRGEMMYDATVYREVIPDDPDAESYEVEYRVYFAVTDPGAPPTFDPVHGGDPGWAPEFEITDISEKIHKLGGDFWTDVSQNQHVELADWIMTKRWESLREAWEEQR